jgi:uncharacterized protein YbjT (DUF2867 family)
MTKPKILVTGANGRTGRPIVAALAKAGASVRAFIRNADQAEALTRMGAEDCAVGDMLNPASIARAVAGCDKIVHIGPPMHPQEVDMTLSFLHAAQQAGLSHFIYYSVMHPLRRGIRHHALKLDAEEHIVESGMPYTILEPTRYMQHLEPIWRDVTEKHVHAMPFNVDAPFNVADLLDLAEVTAKVVTEDGHLYATYELAGPQALSQTDMARILSEELGYTVTAREIPLDELAATGKQKGLSADRIEQMLIMNEHYDAHGFPGNPNILTWLLGRAPGDYRAYVRRLKAHQSSIALPG